ncbi:DUF1330 domain-containing protein [Streptomyces huiliensis]|uniref:DUF1330 domain-containing protein n=1 Tax=Streptomyces huiliensis TaxID=2876027 RepID=UPI001CBDA709|nr:DUF1330 domain-containing protein [Streptomyces huiliensis]MBZ4318971.1 DUF1330 domain-containing protein [Streptomyces huiliensis]
MPAYVIVEADVLDAEAAGRYHRAAEPSIRAHGGRYLVKGGAPEAVEGERPAARLIVIEFPDRERIRRWYASPEYTRARELRRTAVRLRMVVADGVAE